MNVWFTADTHFCHDKAVTFRDEQGYSDWREMNEDLVERWNSAVSPGDTVWHLGDFALCSGDPEKKAALDELIQRLNGTIKLVGGNHDHKWIVQYMDEMYGLREWKGCIMSHMPVNYGQADRYRANIHGHTHKQKVMCGEELVWIEVDPSDPDWDPNKTYQFNMETGKLHDIQVIDKPDPWYICVSVEQWDYAPAPAEEVRRLIPRS